MTAEAILRQASGKQPAELVNALLRAGFAIVPTTLTPAMDGRRMLNAHKPPADRFAAIVEEGRVKL